VIVVAAIAGCSDSSDCATDANTLALDGILDHPARDRARSGGPRSRGRREPRIATVTIDPR